MNCTNELPELESERTLVHYTELLIPIISLNPND